MLYVYVNCAVQIQRDTFNGLVKYLIFLFRSNNKCGMIKIWKKEV